MVGSRRNELWAIDGASWLLAGRYPDAPHYREPPADAFFPITVELKPLSDIDARRLLKAHGEAPDQAQLRQILAAVAGPLAARLVEYLVDHGPVSASDTKMVRQVGASRQRASAS